MSLAVNNFWNVVLRRDRPNFSHLHQNTPSIQGPSVSHQPHTAVIPQLLTVISVDYCTPKNGFEHRTHRFHTMSSADPCLVIRRGQPFNIIITFNRPISLEVDAISFIFTLEGVKPNHGQGTLVAIPLLRTSEVNAITWIACVEKQEENRVTIRMKSTHRSCVGKWKLQIDTKSRCGLSAKYVNPMPFYLLFNSWCYLDEVFIDADVFRQEYVISDSGFICAGVYDQVEKIPWQYSQYEKGILDSCFSFISDISKIRGKFRSDPIHMARAISSIVNNGLMVGKWNGNYANGIAPYQWVNSVDIFQAYYKTKKPVKYGHCYVFSALVTTICRAIGIPCRVVTNYESARDTGGSLTVDHYINPVGVTLENNGMSDGIWSFHVWNEVWLQRPDLGTKYSGWQVIDSTPQESSKDRVHQCGPASVIALKLGEVQKCHDNLMVYSELNAEKINWKYFGPNTQMRLINVDYAGVGKKVATKQSDRWSVEEITESYKTFERPVEVRSPLVRAINTARSGFAKYNLNRECEFIKFEFAPTDQIRMGKSFTVMGIIENTSEILEFMLLGHFKVDVCLYNGKHIKTIKRMEFNRVIDALGKVEVQLTVAVRDYCDLAHSQYSFKMTCMGEVPEGSHEWYAEKYFVVKKPDININVMSVPYECASRDVNVTLDFKNPLPMPLKQCVFYIVGCGLRKHYKLKKSVQAGDYATLTLSLRPDFTGSHTLIAKFSSNELNDITGILNFSLS